MPNFMTVYPKVSGLSQQNKQQ